MTIRVRSGVYRLLSTARVNLISPELLLITNLPLSSPGDETQKSCDSTSQILKLVNFCFLVQTNAQKLSDQLKICSCFCCVVLT